MATASYTESARVVCGQNVLHSEYETYPTPKDFLKTFKQGLKINCIRNEYEHCEFDLIGVNAAIANALRRIMIAEVETVAIDKVLFRNNTGIMQDEVFAHRLGLLPIKFNPKHLRRVTGRDCTATDLNTLVFKLDVTCTEEDLKKAAKDAGGVPEGASLHRSVYARDLVWIPQGNQETQFGEGEKPKFVYPDILLTKLSLGQSIQCEIHAQRGMGKVHAKWSPAATVTYRMLPEVQIVKPIEGELARELKKRDVTNVFRLVEDSNAKGGIKAVVSDVRNCTMSRECMRENNELAESIKLSRRTNHFIFSVESAGQISARDVFIDAIGVLMDKTDVLMTALKELKNNMEVE
eukprot:g2843.t1